MLELYLFGLIVTIVTGLVITEEKDKIIKSIMKKVEED